jgi:hypothetical protein
MTNKELVISMLAETGKKRVSPQSSKQLRLLEQAKSKKG